MAGEAESRNLEPSERMDEAEAKRRLTRKLQKEKQAKEYGKHNNTEMRIDSIFAKITANQNQWELMLNDAWECKGMQQWRYEFEQNHMERAMTDQVTLIADTDKARSFNRDCKEEMA